MKYYSYDEKSKSMTLRETERVTTMENLFNEWTSNKNVNVSFSRYVQSTLNRGIWVEDLGKYKNLLKGGNRRDSVF